MAKRHRSPSYPAFTLTESLKRAKQFYDKEGKHSAPVNVAVTHWGYAPKSSGGLQTISALKSYGLVLDEGKGATRKIRLSQNALKIIFDEREDTSELDELKATAAKRPKIIAQLLAEFPDGKISDSNLQYYLKNQSFNQNTVPDIIKVYKDALKYLSGAISNVYSDKDKKIEHGDYVQWESGGILQFKEPKRVRAFQESEGTQYLFVEGSDTGIPMSEVTIEKKGSDERMPPLVIPPPVLPELNSTREREWLRGQLAPDTNYRLVISGDIGPKEIGKLIKLLEAQKIVLTDDD